MDEVAVTIGQTPRPDLEKVFHRHLPGVTLVVRGALDGLSVETIDGLAAAGGEYPPVHHPARRGTTPKYSLHRLKPLLDERAREVAADGAAVAALMCAGNFPDLASPIPVLYPSRVLAAVVRGVCRGERDSVSCCQTPGSVAGGGPLGEKAFHPAVTGPPPRAGALARAAALWPSRPGTDRPGLHGLPTRGGPSDARRCAADPCSAPGLVLGSWPRCWGCDDGECPERGGASLAPRKVCPHRCAPEGRRPHPRWRSADRGDPRRRHGLLRRACREASDGARPRRREAAAHAWPHRRAQPRARPVADPEGGPDRLPRERAVRLGLHAGAAAAARPRGCARCVISAQVARRCTTTGSTRTGRRGGPGAPLGQDLPRNRHPARVLAIDPRPEQARPRRRSVLENAAAGPAGVVEAVGGIGPQGRTRRVLRALRRPLSALQ